MGLLDSFERGLERAVNGAFAKTFKSGVQPVELTSALRRELDTNAVIVARDRILAPNRFVVRLSPADHERMSSLGPTLIDELTSLVQRHAGTQGYQFAGGVSIRLQQDENLSEGIIRVDSQNVKGEIAWVPVLDINGKRHRITRSRTVVGRGSDADITVDDSSISRKHVEILWDGKNAQVNDLGSTNGSELNGKKVSKAPLPTDSVISIGRTRIVFRVLAQSASPETADARSDHPGNGR
ncbi:DUF3662 and FHA domain-containing protein [Salinibacterium sp. SYSU T00001]|uniref:FhaA domain-containing protein n=1 Tax=Homoserinimonas sedimenticola TaxID=2986805 RepID=UPI0022356CBF|nr:DUF3662 and FHA domain-containing protein [Salinibacterium sedimenticola]MCW4385829.1 DUF3662 and FHA domain-containing protein [Salinibacterium sedimenticola]